MLLDIIIFAQIILVIILCSTHNYNTVVTLKRVVLTTFAISILLMILASPYLTSIQFFGVWLIEGSASIISFIISQKYKFKGSENFNGSC